MDTLELLGTALGLATLAGLNLYLTVFVTGLAIRMDWIHLSQQYEQLEVLGDPVILAISGTFFVLEFFADKVPWVDSLWDSLHTIIRPVGGALVAITVLGDTNPVYDVIVGLLGGGLAMTSHAMKAGTRLVANTSPEPVSNIALSLGEDAIVLAGLGLVATNPVLALALSIIAFLFACWLIPRIFRSARTTLWLLWRRIDSLFGSGKSAAPYAGELPGELAAELRRMDGPQASVAWAAPCISGRGSEIRANQFGWIFLTAGDQSRLYFALRKNPRPVVTEIPIDGRKFGHRPGFIREKLVIAREDETVAQVLQFDCSRRQAVSELLELLRPTAVTAV